MFGSYAVTTRSQVVTFLWRYMGKPAAAGIYSFSDVIPGAWYEAPIVWAVGAGIVEGITEDYFGVDDNCTRAHAATFLYRAIAD
jgi:hypothetical protein